MTQPAAPLTIVGDSHMASVHGFASQRDVPIRFVLARDFRSYRDRGVLRARDLRGLEATAVFEMLGGNKHLRYGLLEQDPPLDFACPHDPGVDTDRYVAPYSMLRTMMTRNLASDCENISLLASRFEAVAHVVPPPPIPDGGHLRRFPGRFAGAMERGITPARIRMKWYRLQQDILAEHCATCGVDVIPPPASGLDPQGFLREEFWSHDPTHANAGYGELVYGAMAGWGGIRGRSSISRQA